MTKKKPRLSSAEIYFDFDCKDLLNILFQLQLKAEIHLDLMKTYIKDNSIDLESIFNFLDYDENGFLTLNEVILKKYFFSLSDYLWSLITLLAMMI
jgi:hypothetical protein